MPLRDTTDLSGMSRHQLQDRLRTMESTATRNTQLGSPNDRHRPMEDRRRAERIALYRAEIDRRLLQEAQDEQITQEANEAAADAASHAAEESSDDMNIHDYEYKGDEAARYQQRDEDLSRHDQDKMRDKPDYTAIQHYTIPAPAKAHDYERLTVECPQCHAPAGQRCTNYRGQRCAPHGQRKAPAAPLSAPPIAETPTPDAGEIVPTPRTPEYRAAKRTAQAAADARKEKVKSIRAEVDADGDLATQCEALVRKYGLGNTLDAVWAADKVVWAARQQQEKASGAKAS